ncbi:MAG: DUF2806 domain-containing protein, partial [Deltaproteobacteria bacterium]|nr:DUF2806 domain-containing protein [Deltaproteobacteria bacterium]
MSETNFSLVNLKALSKPATKLIEAVSSACGILFEPRRIRRKANADADATVILAKSQVECRDIEVRASERLRKRELRRQENIENITSEAMKALPETVSDEPIDEDWVYRFFDNCQDVGKEDMQYLWGKLLAGEVSKPGTYSMLTLSVVKNLSVEDANLFTKLCSFNWKINDKYFPILSSINKDESLKIELSIDELMHLSSFDLVNFDPINRFMLYFEGQEFESGIVAVYYDSYYTINHNKKESLLDTGGVRFTYVGQELAHIAGGKGSDKYRDSILEMWRKQGFI